MKHFSFLILFGLAQSALGQAAMDTLLFEDFENDPDSYIQITVPFGSEDYWINYDGDQLPDKSGQARPDQWFLNTAFSDEDGGTSVYMSNSWTLDPMPVANYLILPPLQINDTSAMLSWKSAPRQTPLYLDGYYVVVSTTFNYEPAFTDTLFKAAEYLSTNDLSTDSGFSHFTFSSGWIHGEDGTFIQYDNDSIRLIGVLHPFSASLSAYAGQTIYIAFVHGTVDDNLISVDDILVTAKKFTGIQDPEPQNTVTAFPNPANDMITLRFHLPQSSHVYVDLLNSEGKTVKSQVAGTLIKGDIGDSR